MPFPARTLGFKTSPQAVDWPTLDETWALAGECEALDAAWMNDHVTDPRQEHGGAALTHLPGQGQRVGLGRSARGEHEHRIAVPGRP